MPYTNQQKYISWAVVAVGTVVVAEGKETVVVVAGEKEMVAAAGKGTDAVGNAGAVVVNVAQAHAFFFDFRHT